jgi:hypothetical protein
MSLIDIYTKSTLGIVGNNIPEPAKGSPAWGYAAPDNIIDPVGSKLHNLYSTVNNPTMRIINFKNPYAVKVPSILEENDPNSLAPKNPFWATGLARYSSAQGSGYAEKGPKDGRY